MNEPTVRAPKLPRCHRCHVVGQRPPLTTILSLGFATGFWLDTLVARRTWHAGKRRG